MIDETADAIIRRWPTPQPKAQTASSRRDWRSFAFWLVRIVVEGLGWLGILGLISRL